MTPLLSVEGLRVSYGDQLAVHGLTLSLEQGQCLAILGANGAGKSSVLGAISGLVRPVRGTIHLDGTRIDRLRADLIRGRGILHVPEGRGVFPSLTVADNLRVLLGPDKVGRARVLEQFPKLAERLQQTAGTMSGGEQQMLALAPAIAGDQQVLLVDELSLGLAPLIVDALFTHLEEIRASGVSMIIVEQFAERALGLADTAIVMRKGEAVYVGAASDLASQPELLRSLYFGAAA